MVYILMHELLFICQCRLLKGNGQVVDGDKKVTYTHRDITTWFVSFATENPHEGTAGKEVHLVVIYFLGYFSSVFRVRFKLYNV